MRREDRVVEESRAADAARQLGGVKGGLPEAASDGGVK